MAVGNEWGYPCLSHTSSHKMPSNPASWGLTKGVADQADRPHLAPSASFKAQRVLLKTSTSDLLTSSPGSDGLSSSLTWKFPYLRSWGCFRSNFDHHLLPEACSFCWPLLPMQVNSQGPVKGCPTASRQQTQHKGLCSSTASSVFCRHYLLKPSSLLLPTWGWEIPGKSQSLPLTFNATSRSFPGGTTIVSRAKPGQG